MKAQVFYFLLIRARTLGLNLSDIAAANSRVQIIIQNNMYIL